MKKSISCLVIEACKCVFINRLRHFLMKRKGLILNQNKCINKHKTTHLPGTLSPRPTRFCPGPVVVGGVGWGLTTLPNPSVFSLSCISILKSWQVCLLLTGFPCCCVVRNRIYVIMCRCTCKFSLHIPETAFQNHENYEK